MCKKTWGNGWGRVKKVNIPEKKEVKIVKITQLPSIRNTFYFQGDTRPLRYTSKGLMSHCT
jgi:hypothetical protein